MARQLTAVPDIVPPDGSYPAGRIKNEVTPDPGTPVIEELYGDIIQFFHKLMRLAGIAYNDLPENETTGFQSIQALAAYVRTLQATDALKGTVELATNAETQAGVDTQRVVTPASLESKTANAVRKGIIEISTFGEILAGIDDTRAITPLGLASLTSLTTRRGIIQIATAAEVLAGSNNAKCVTPETLEGKTATTDGKGISELATDAEAIAGTDTQRTVTPAALLAVRNDIKNTNQAWQALIIDSDYFDAGTVQYYKDNAGNVHVRGYDISPNATYSGTTIILVAATPVGYRPSGVGATNFLIITNTGGKICQLIVSNLSGIRINASPNALATSDIISFYVIYRAEG